MCLYSKSGFLQQPRQQGRARGLVARRIYRVASDKRLCEFNRMIACVQMEQFPCFFGYLLRYWKDCNCIDLDTRIGRKSVDSDKSERRNLAVAQLLECRSKLR